MRGHGWLGALLLLWATAAYGDGGALLRRQDAGPFTVSLFASPQPLETGRAEVSALVQQRETAEVLLDAVTDLDAVPLDSDGLAQHVRLASANAGNRLLQAADLQLSQPGRWRLTVRARRGKDVGQMSMECTVLPSHSRSAVLWFFMVLPVGVILIFVLHQSLQRRHVPLRRGN